MQEPVSSSSIDYTVTEQETANNKQIADLSAVPARGRILAIDPGTKRCGIAVCDELRVTVSSLKRLERTSWKKLLSNIRELVAEYDAVAIVVGLPLESDGSDGPMTAEARDIARKLTLSLDIPVLLQDERVTSYEAKGRLWAAGKGLKESRDLVDSEAAAIILEDFLLQANG
ncbi:MAG TPA: Holliday junction resolvase RuvX [Pyrinomonadaceae bacterium]|nr:Holliday junction resolvase RuvX [Pyrinomonadaceae bacterium]